MRKKIWRIKKLIKTKKKLRNVRIKIIILTILRISPTKLYKVKSEFDTFNLTWAASRILQKVYVFDYTFLIILF